MILKIDFKIKLLHDRVDVCCPHMAKCRVQASQGVRLSGMPSSQAGMAIKMSDKGLQKISHVLYAECTPITIGPGSIRFMI